MKGLGRRILAVAASFAMVASVIPQSAVVYATETDLPEYQIYPTPHSVDYEDTVFTVDSNVNVVFESDIDEVTENKLKNVLTDNGLTVSESDKTTDGTNILVGIYGSDEYADAYAEENLTFDTATFEEIDGYVLDVDAAEKTIVVLGKDTDAAFYGIVSLMHILDQSEELKVRDLTMEDYADTSIRGFIEGYYGIPWSNEDRMSLMEFGGQFKMTCYVFAPKDDPYHTTKWRDEYPEEEIEAIAEMVAVGNANKCRFVWTAHPFMGGFDSSDVDGEIEALLNKFEQLYSVGVRQFGVLGDDVGSLNKDVVIQVMTAVSEWADAKGDVYDSVFCPAGYNHSWQGNYSELNTYDAGFPDNVQIFWTGEAVCQPVEQKTLDHFRDYNATNGERRAPLFWLNWPVNDINGKRLMMGKGSLLQTDVNPDDLVGVVTNPMQEAEASKVAIFAVADYAWNIADFDCDQSWDDSFEYIDADASEELHTLAKHMSNPEPNGHGLVLAESEELQPLIAEFEAKLANGESLAEVVPQLVDEMDIIMDACDGFFEKSQNENLKEELEPFAGSLKDLANAIKNYALAALALENEENMAAFEYFMTGSEAMDNSENHVRQGLDSIYLVSPGSTHLIPLAETIEEAIAEEITEYALGEIDRGLTLTASSSFTSFYGGTAVENIVDGDLTTYAWYGGYEAAGQYFQVNLSKPSTVYGIDILNGTTSKPQDTFGNAKVQYTTDGTTWVDVTDTVYSDYQDSVVIEDIEIENVIAVRYICTAVGSSNKWPAMREFTVITDNGNETGVVYTNAEAYAEAEAYYSIDTNSITPITNVTLESGEYIGLKLDRIHELQAIEMNEIEGLSLQIAKNSMLWDTVDADEVAGADARYIRLVNEGDEAITFDIENFVVTTTEIYGKSVSDTNYTSFEGDELAVFDGDWTTATQFANSQTVGKYVVYDLGTVIDMESFKVVCTDSEWDFPRHAKFSVSVDGENWTEIMTLGNQDSENEGESTTEDEIGSVLPDHEISYNTKTVDGLDVPARFLKFEITRTKTGADKWVRFQEFEINGGEFIPTANDPTYEGAPESFTAKYANMTDANLATAYTPDAAEGSLIYYVSEPGMNNLKFIQSGISNATVEVQTMADNENWVKLGTLSESITELKCDGVNTTEILAVKITWEDTNLKLIEMQITEGEYGPVVEPTPTPTPVENPFTDINDTQYYYGPILWAYESEITDGATDTTFNPEGICTRGQVVTFLYRAAGSPEVKADTCKFTDVKASDYYYNAVLWAVEKGITDGTSDTTFSPDQECTRGHVVTFLYRAAGEPAVSTATSKFTDISEGQYYYNAVLWAVEKGITDGTSDTQFSPDATCVRGQVVTFLYRYCGPEA